MEFHVFLIVNILEPYVNSGLIPVAMNKIHLKLQKWTATDDVSFYMCMHFAW